MPTLVRTPFNQGGSYQSDPFDAEDQGNRSAAVQMLGMQMGAQQNNALTQLALAQLKSGDYHYAQDRSDRMGSQQALFGYLGGRDKVADQRWKFENDPSAGNPFLKSQVNLNDAQSGYMQFLINQGKTNAENTANAGNTGLPDFTPRNPQETAAVSTARASGMPLTVAQNQVLAKRAEAAKGAIQGEQNDYGSAIDDVVNSNTPNVGSIAEWASPERKRMNDAQNSLVLNKRTKLKQDLLDSGQAQNDEQAETILRGLETKHRPLYGLPPNAERLFAALNYH